MNVLYEGSSDSSNLPGRPRREPRFYDHISGDQREIVESQIENFNANRRSIGTLTDAGITLNNDKEIQELLIENLKTVVESINSAIKKLQEVNPISDMGTRLTRIEDKLDKLSRNCMQKHVSEPKNLPTRDGDTRLTRIEDKLDKLSRNCMQKHVSEPKNLPTPDGDSKGFDPPKEAEPIHIDNDDTENDDTSERLMQCVQEIMDSQENCDSDDLTDLYPGPLEELPPWTRQPLGDVTAQVNCNVGQGLQTINVQDIQPVIHQQQQPPAARPQQPNHAQQQQPLSAPRQPLANPGQQQQPLANPGQQQQPLANPGQQQQPLAAQQQQQPVVQGPNATRSSSSSTNSPSPTSKRQIQLSCPKGAVVQYISSPFVPCSSEGLFEFRIQDSLVWDARGDSVNSGNFMWHLTQKIYRQEEMMGKNFYGKRQNKSNLSPRRRHALVHAFVDQYGDDKTELSNAVASVNSGLRYITRKNGGKSTSVARSIVL